jgi:heat shock protein HslJ
MRSLTLTLLAVASLLSPAAALATTPSAATAIARFFEIRALVFGGTKLEVTGKIAFQGDQLTASAGCNTIGGTVRVDGDTVTIVGPTFTTEMACLSTHGQAMLIKILGLGTFRITDSGWVADGGQIVTVEVAGTGPGPAASPSDEPVSSSPAATIAEPVPVNPPGASCPPVPVDNNTTPVDSGAPFGGSGGATGSGGSSVSGGGSVGSGTATTGPGVVVPDATAVTGAGGVEPPPPAPVPGGTPSLGQVEPEPSLGVVPPGPIGNDPNVGKPADPCGQGVASNMVAPGAAAAKADTAAAAEHAARNAADRTALLAPLVAALGILLVLGAGIYRRRRATSR